MNVADTTGTRLPRIRVVPPGPVSRSMSERLALAESRNVTFSGDGWPVFWDSAVGANVTDVDGNVYIDLTSAFGVSLMGHRAPAVVRAIEEQSRRLLHGMGDVHPPAIKLELLERLSALAPWPDARVLLATTGSGAVEAALKTARLASGRAGILAFEGGYHGLTMGSLAVTSRDHFRRPFHERLYGGVVFAPFPELTAGHFEGGGSTADRCLARVADLLDAGAPNGDAIGTLIIEPVQARGGARVPPTGFMAELTRLARAREVLIVADEVMTGLGRCGGDFASPLVGLEPDLICVGKALGGGLPISACLAARGTMDAWARSDGEAIHTSTFLGHPLACAAAIAVLEAYHADRIAERAQELGGSLLTGLADRLADSPRVGEVRGLGLLLGIELVTPGSRIPEPGAAVRVAESALRRGVLVLPAGDDGRVVELTPPVTLTTEQVEYVIDVLSDIIQGSR